MKWSFLDRAIAIWACCIASCAIIFVCVGLSGLIAENSSNIASWVQAIGSVAAIIFGFVLVNYQLKIQRSVEKSRESRNRIDEMRYSLAMLENMLDNSRINASTLEKHLASDNIKIGILKLQLSVFQALLANHDHYFLSSKAGYGAVKLSILLRLAILFVISAVEEGISICDNPDNANAENPELARVRDIVSHGEKTFCQACLFCSLMIKELNRLEEIPTVDYQIKLLKELMRECT